ncbi:MAG: macro domain-containing protein [Bacilli bacterium]|nr:macro domain-containing protein [Bacilli bacterium]
MLFNYYSGDVFSSGAQVIVHQVNCMGVMGSGVARIVREKYPEVYLEYKKAVETLEGNCLGGCLLVGRIANLFGQYYYRGYKDEYFGDEFWKQPEMDNSGRPIRFTNYEAFYNGLVRLRNIVQGRGDITTIAFPYKIGCDRGGGSWGIIESMIKEVFGKTNINIEVWKYQS